MDRTYVQQVMDVFHDKGIIVVFKRFIYKTYMIIINSFRGIFLNYNYVFCCESLPGDAEALAGFSVSKYARANDIPPDIMNNLTREFGIESIEVNTRLMATKGCVLWVAFLHEAPACIALSRKGKHIPKWFVALDPEDIVIFRVNTLQACRGKGLSPALTRHIMRHELKDGGKAYWDCKIYNKPSIRAAEKAGFHCVAKMKPIRE